MRVKAIQVCLVIGWWLIGIHDIYKRDYLFGSEFVLIAVVYAMPIRRKPPSESAELKDGIGPLRQ